MKDKRKDEGVQEKTVQKHVYRKNCPGNRIGSGKPTADADSVSESLPIV
jgi:hypothetical protein